MKYLILMLITSSVWGKCQSFAPCIEINRQDEEKFSPRVIERDTEISQSFFANEIINVSRSYIGTPYLFGGEGQGGIDCSAFIQQVFASVGFTLPRTSGQQFEDPRLSAVEDLAPLDLLFFKTRDGRRIDHVALYIGEGQMIHSSKKEGGVQITDFKFSQFWSSRYVGARRINITKENI
jgi:cell wall-associated NlpC family hydrolase